jgi:hypothetical protein
MSALNVAKQRPQFGLQPRHLQIAPGVRGHASLLMASLMVVSVRTLQEHTIIKSPNLSLSTDYQNLSKLPAHKAQDQNAILQEF